MKMQASLGFTKLFSANVSKSQFHQNFLPPSFVLYGNLKMHRNILIVDNILYQFRYHQKCWYWPDTGTDIRIGAALVTIVHTNQ